MPTYEITEQIGDDGERPDGDERNYSGNAQNPTDASEYTLPSSVKRSMPKMKRAKITKALEHELNEFYSCKGDKRKGTRMFQVSKLQMGKTTGVDAYNKEIPFTMSHSASGSAQEIKGRIEDCLQKTIKNRFEPALKNIKRTTLAVEKLEGMLKHPIYHRVQKGDKFKLRGADDLSLINVLLGSFPREQYQFQHVVDTAYRQTLEIFLHMRGEFSIKRLRELVARGGKIDALKVHTVYSTDSRKKEKTIYEWARRVSTIKLPKPYNLPAGVFPPEKIDNEYADSLEDRPALYSRPLKEPMFMYKVGSKDVGAGKTLRSAYKKCESLIKFIREARHDITIKGAYLVSGGKKMKLRKALGNVVEAIEKAQKLTQYILCRSRNQFQDNTKWAMDNFSNKVSDYISTIEKYVTELEVLGGEYRAVFSNAIPHKTLVLPVNEKMGSCQGGGKNPMAYGLGIYDWFSNADMLAGYVYTKDGDQIIGRIIIRRMYNEELYPGKTLYQMDRLYMLKGFYQNIKKDIYKSFVVEFEKTLGENEGMVIPLNSAHDSSIYDSYIPLEMRGRSAPTEELATKLNKGTSNSDNRYKLLYQSARPANCGKYNYYHDSRTQTTKFTSLKKDYFVDTLPFRETVIILRGENSIFDVDSDKQMKTGKSKSIGKVVQRLRTLTF